MAGAIEEGYINMQSKSVVNQALAEHKIIAILRGLTREQVEPTVEAMYEGGIRLMEITFNQNSETGVEDTMWAIEKIIGLKLDGLYVGAGTIMTVAQADAAADAGAAYMLSPNLNISVMNQAHKRGLLTMPGCFTPSEIAAAYAAGADYIKVFPAGRIGPGYLKELQGPMGHIPLLAVGGIDQKNMWKYLDAGAKGVGVGSHITNLVEIQEGKYGNITKRAREYSKQVK